MPLVVYILFRGDECYIFRLNTVAEECQPLEEGGFEVNPRDILVARKREDGVDQCNTTHRMSK